MLPSLPFDKVVFVDPFLQGPDLGLSLVYRHEPKDVSQWIIRV